MVYRFDQFYSEEKRIGQRKKENRDKNTTAKERGLIIFRKLLDLES